MNKYQFRRLCDRILRFRLVKIYSCFFGIFSDDVGGNKISFNLNSDIGRKLFFEGHFEKDEMSLCKNYISKNSIILDVGANIGVHSIYFSTVATEGLVFAIEPSPKTYNILLKNIFSKKNILPVNMAISDKAGILDFYEAEDDAYSSLKNTKRKKIQNVHPVLVFSIDKFISDFHLKHVDLIKIDVEGLEHNVLKGMQTTMKNFKPTIFCEIYKGTCSNMNPEESIKLICSNNYSAFVVVNGRLVPYQSHDDSQYNYVFLPNA